MGPPPLYLPPIAGVSLEVLETVVPKSLHSLVMIVRGGANRGQVNQTVRNIANMIYNHNCEPFCFLKWMYCVHVIMDFVSFPIVFLPLGYLEVGYDSVGTTIQ